MSFGNFGKKRSPLSSTPSTSDAARDKPAQGPNSLGPSDMRNHGANDSREGGTKYVLGDPSRVTTGRDSRPSGFNSDAAGASPQRLTTSRYTANSRIAPSTRIKGGIFLPGVAEFGGELEGELVSEEHIIVADAGHVKGKIHGKNITLHGTVEGDIIAKGTLTLRAPARVIGNITCSGLAIEEGVYFKGNCTMEQAVQRKGSDEPAAGSSRDMVTAA